MLNPFEAALTRRHVQLAEANLFHWGVTAPGLLQAPAQDCVASARWNGESHRLRAGGNAASFFPAAFCSFAAPIRTRHGAAPTRTRREIYNL